MVMACIQGLVECLGEFEGVWTAAKPWFGIGKGAGPVVFLLHTMA